MKTTFPVTICGIFQLDITADPNNPSDVLEEVHIALSDLNITLSATELESEPQFLTSGLDTNDLQWSENEEEE